MVGRLSVYAKNRILNLRFQKNSKIKHIASTLLLEDNIKVSRESVSTFLKKYIDTKSIFDKPRSGRNKKLTKEEIELIGEVTRLNRDITAPKIKHYLSLNVSTHTILRASKLFEWNQSNPNSNKAKKAAAIGRRQLPGESKPPRLTQNSQAHSSAIDSTELSSPISSLYENCEDLTKERSLSAKNKNVNLNLLSEKEILCVKNMSSSPMVFASKVLLKIFNADELYGHNVTGKTFCKNFRHKKALDEKRVSYIRWLVENYFEAQDKEAQWKMCRTSINKAILISEKKAAKQSLVITGGDLININNISSCVNSGATLTSTPDLFTYNNPGLFENMFKMDVSDLAKFKNTNKDTLKVKPSIPVLEVNYESTENILDANEGLDLKLISQNEVRLLRSHHCSPMIFATRVLMKIFDPKELGNQSLQVTRLKQTPKRRNPLDERRIMYIKYLVEKYFNYEDKEFVWKSCRKAINRILRNIEKKTNPFKSTKKSDNVNIPPVCHQNTHVHESYANTRLDQESFAVGIDQPVKKNFKSAAVTETDNNQTIVVLVDDPEHQRQMTLENEADDLKVGKMAVYDNNHANSKSSSILTTSNALNIGTYY